MVEIGLWGGKEKFCNASDADKVGRRSEYVSAENRENLEAYEEERKNSMGQG